MSEQAVIWDLALIQKYNQSGPRYTSYPTALEFHQDFGADAFQQAVARYPDRPLSLYVHIPFCHKLCYFCGCNKVVPRQRHKAEVYLIGSRRRSSSGHRCLRAARSASCTGAAAPRPTSTPRKSAA